MTLTEHITSKDVNGSQAAYDLLRSEYESVAAMPLTSQRVVREAQLRKALEAAAQKVEEAKSRQAEALAAETEKKKEAARKQLTETEADMAKKAAKAEKLMDELAPLLIDLDVAGKRRYGAKAEITGRAEHGLLPTSIIVGWVRHRLADLGSAVLGRAMRHQRGPLGDLLGLTAPGTEEVEK